MGWLPEALTACTLSLDSFKENEGLLSLRERIRDASPSSGKPAGTQPPQRPAERTHQGPTAAAMGLKEPGRREVTDRPLSEREMVAIEGQGRAEVEQIAMFNQV